MWLKTSIAAVVMLAVCGVVRGEDGSRLWLRWEPVESRLKGKVEVVGDSLAARELRVGMKGLVGEGKAIKIRVENGAGTGEEGFVIREKEGEIVVGSEGERGRLYGVFHLLRLVQTGKLPERLDVREKPAFVRRMLNHWDNLDGSVERGYAGKSIWEWDQLPGKVSERYEAYGRACASVGINRVVLNNVNAKPAQLNSENLKKAAVIAEALRPWGIQVMLCVNFGSPKALGGLKTADPLDEEVKKWWGEKFGEIYRLIPDFAGVLVKANSEGQPGPRDYGRSHAEGANMLGEVLKPHGGEVIWRCFVYEGTGEKDRAKRAYVEFKKHDGEFGENVSLQVKNGPIDFQPREMFHPLFGGMEKTPLVAELEVTQENMGHSTALVSLGYLWEEFFGWETYRGGTIAKLLTAQKNSGVAGVANVGLDQNWCGHEFAQANWYSFGRLAWDPTLKADAISEEWVRMTWGNDPGVVSVISGMMRESWPAVVDYEMPIGLTHIMEGGSHYGPSPKEFWEYHKAGKDGIGFDRTASGSNGVGQYAPEIAAKYGKLETCPDELLLWFHHVPWEYRMKSGRTVWGELVWRYTNGVERVKGMQREWEKVKGKVDEERFEAVKRKLAEQVRDAAVWRDRCIAYFAARREGIEVK